MPRELIAHCGQDCRHCRVYRLTRFADRTGWKGLARKMLGKGESGDIWCDGCVVIGGRTLKAVRECLVRCCAMERGKATCAHCERFGCQWLQDLWRKPGFRAAQNRLKKLNRRLLATGQG